MNQLVKLLLLFLLSTFFACQSETGKFPHSEVLQAFYYGGEDIKVAPSSEYTESWEWESMGPWQFCKKEAMAYRVHYNDGSRYIIELYYDAPGTGIFTRLVDLDYNGTTTVLINDLGGGDRCWHGIPEGSVRVEGKTVTYAEKLTAYRIMDFFDNKYTRSPYDEMLREDTPKWDHCQGCCIAYAHFRYDIATKIKTLVSFELTAYHINLDDEFSQLYNKVVKEGENTFFTPDEMKEFIAKVKEVSGS